MNAANVGEIAIYGCGGGGTNTVARFLEASKRQPEKNQATLRPVFIDTSRSNLAAGIDESNSYILQDTDGSGGLRSENYGAINSVLKEILHTHKPLAMNLVVFTASGGSGSVIGPLIISELLSRNEAVIAIVIGGDESAKAAENSLKTLKSLDGISAATGKAIVTYYRQNERNVPRYQTDNDIDLAINALAILASRQIRELDSQDVFNFLNYNRVTNVAPGVAGLAMYGSDTSELDKTGPVSVISIRKDADQPSFNHIPGFLKEGYADVNLAGNTSLFYAVDVNQPSRWTASLEKTIDQINQASDARPVANRLSANSDVKTDRGMVL